MIDDILKKMAEFGKLHQLAMFWVQELVQTYWTTEFLPQNKGFGTICCTQDETMATVAAVDHSPLLLVDTLHSKLLHDSLHVWIVGCLNADKLSLLNLLTSRDATIVSSISNSTRDFDEVVFNLGGMWCPLLDTAGLRVNMDEGGGEQCWGWGHVEDKSGGPGCAPHYPDGECQQLSESTGGGKGLDPDWWWGQ
jgi:hypothetical protein